MRKTTSYARKLKLANNSFNGAEWLNAVSRCRSYDSELIPGAVAKEPTFAAAEKSIINVRKSFELIKNGAADSDDFDRLCHATGVTKIRGIQIGGDDNIMAPVLNTADLALNKCKTRFLKWGKWELLESEIAQISEALDLYEMVLVNSSPEQMNIAVDIRQQILAEIMEAA